jgi:hypothetical protein
MPSEKRTRRVTGDQTRTYLGKAEEFVLAARKGRDARRPRSDQPGSAQCDQLSDAISGVRMGQRAVGSDHAQAIELLTRAGREGKEVARILTHLIPLKNRAEYEPREVPTATVSRAVDQAERILQIARQVAG